MELEKYAKFLEDYANFVKNNKPIINIPLSPEELLSEASRIRALSRVKRENGLIIVKLAEGNAEHWAHFEGEVIMTFDNLYRPLKIEIEIKDTMDSEKVLKDANLIGTS
ncbi:hypothetical protein SULI_12675 [Saccharolobus solfataricus]|nr:hypothetical protein [Saccharolobus solfataricus]AKA74629.1 hypothetical protein SULB_2500 [Saccharolobus solfataricus]AKA77323.1 hypothetical protein SULC_2495 [Saccharolobus solfataricus]AKA80014.1 hypothetical protein SULA_2497 [Saccharolobus solfataricus]AZF69096.1 hypothetical protein SULG_12675 [Saccharolobus solfataricus]AZF71716.1 hypothetical protein SULH_12675 [Saccharolobus solfataricus]